MKVLKKLGFFLAAAVLAVAFSLNSSGCLNDAQLGPNEENQLSQTKPQFLKIGDGNRSLKKVLQVSQFVTKKDGGELILEYKGDENNNGNVYCKITLKIFAETISEDAELTFSLDDQELVGNIDVQFGRHGITFSKPALLVIEAKQMDLSNTPIQRVDVYYDNADIGQWELMERKEVIVKQDEGYLKVIEAEIPHFSRYAVGWGE